MLSMTTGVTNDINKGTFHSKKSSRAKWQTDMINAVRNTWVWRVRMSAERSVCFVPVTFASLTLLGRTFTVEINSRRGYSRSRWFSCKATTYKSAAKMTSPHIFFKGKFLTSSSIMRCSKSSGGIESHTEEITNSATERLDLLPLNLSTFK